MVSECKLLRGASYETGAGVVPSKYSEYVSEDTRADAVRVSVKAGGNLLMYSRGTDDTVSATHPSDELGGVSHGNPSISWGW